MPGARNERLHGSRTSQSEVGAGIKDERDAFWNELSKTTLAAMLSKFPITLGPQSDSADDHDSRVYPYGIL